MSLSSYFPIWNQLTPEQQHALSGGAALRQLGYTSVKDLGGISAYSGKAVR